jgi:hypothetical protein
MVILIINLEEEYDGSVMENPKEVKISRYHPSSGEGRGVKKTYPCLGE